MWFKRALRRLCASKRRAAYGAYSVSACIGLRHQCN